jgi:hypothetical protein
MYTIISAVLHFVKGVNKKIQKFFSESKMVHSEHTFSLYYIIEASAISHDGSINGISKLANAEL